MKALSVWQPWGWAMFELPAGRWKDIENRTWPAPWVQGKFIAIHAAKKIADPDAWFFIEQAGGQRPPTDVEVGEVGEPLIVTGAIVGVVEVLGFVEQSESPWFVGPVGWLLGRRYRLPEPVPCPGAQGLWNVPPEIEAMVTAGLAEARAIEMRKAREAARQGAQP